MFSPVTVGVLLVFGFAVATADQALMPTAIDRLGVIVPAVLARAIPFLEQSYQVSLAYVHSLFWLGALALLSRGGRGLGAFDLLFIFLVNTASGGAYLVALKQAVEEGFTASFRPLLASAPGAILYVALPFALIAIGFVLGRMRRRRLLRREEQQKERERRRLKEELREEVLRELKAGQS